MKTVVIVLIATALIAGGYGCSKNSDQSYSQIKEQHKNLSHGYAPHLVGTASNWLNTDGKPIHIYGPKAKKGKIYLIDFWEYTCVNCLRTLPYLKSWHKKYADNGLVIIGIHTPEFQFAHKAKNVRAAVKRLGITYPVLIDSKYKNWTAWHNHVWPHEFLVSIQGKIIHEHIGEGAYHQTEKAIRKALLKLHPNLTFGKLTPLARKADGQFAVCYPQTGELYCGYRRGHLANPIGYQRGKAALYRDRSPAHHVDGAVTLNGKWIAQPEYVQPANDNPGNYLAIRYHALDANAVIKLQAGKPIRVIVRQDNQPVAKTDAGKDIHYDKNGDSYLIINQPRMYHIIHNKNFGHHELKLIPESDRFRIYSFSFSSCVK